MPSSNSTSTSNQAHTSPGGLPYIDMRSPCPHHRYHGRSIPSSLLSTHSSPLGASATSPVPTQPPTAQLLVRRSALCKSALCKSAHRRRPISTIGRTMPEVPRCAPIQRLTIIGRLVRIRIGITILTPCIRRHIAGLVKRRHMRIGIYNVIARHFITGKMIRWPGCIGEL